MYKGGYQIIDISGKKFELPGSALFKGVYEKVSGTTKPIMISDFTVGGKHERAAFVQAVKSDQNSDYQILVPNSTGQYLITIKASDLVKIENA